MWHVLALLACAAAIYLSCEWFVNAVEWLGLRLGVARSAVGSILAAAGTALPESVVTLVAVAGGDSPASRHIGVGAAMGGPLALATVAYAVTGIALLVKRRKVVRAAVAAGVGVHAGAHARTAVPVGPLARATAAATGGASPSAESSQPDAGSAGTPDLPRLQRDQRWFLLVFVVKVGLGLVAFVFKPWLGLLFFATYVVYFWREMRGEPDTHADAESGLEQLKLTPKKPDPTTTMVVLQTVGGLAVIFVASQLFVGQLEALGPLLGLPAAVTALLLSPVATELPEIMNAIIWVRQGKTRLALANISGAMMIQATVPSGIGLLGTAWMFDASLVWSGVVTMAAICYLLVLMRTHRLTPGRLALAGVGYLLFAGGLAVILS